VSGLITACAVVARDRYVAVRRHERSARGVVQRPRLCLRLKRAGYRNLLTPHAELVHHESASRGLADDPANARLARERGPLHRAGGASDADPLYKNLALEERRPRSRGRRA
jgi:hypothetical protein